ncbi:NAD(P)(+) transhydrogenase (Re/Si-specific) subunit beta [candidate division KSB1 bacterium]|nr:NAD(P)(+) transhydrogenase (Re/Si-specific) subunit beta [candidate division KSB1 bacterium]RQW05491.1 MAG: NAD(P)(+) transhydrogenase (Re/Si-specific) subunit beta [candidate division KSB1 bacterium]
MQFRLDLLFDLAIILVLFLGIQKFRKPKSARKGNLTAATALSAAIILLFLWNDIVKLHVVFVALLIGATLGWIVSARINMLQIPAMVGLQNGAGGMASFLVSFIELSRYSDSITGVVKFSGMTSLIIGAATLSGSLIASGKLANKIKQTPVIWPKHNWIFGAFVVLIIITASFTLNKTSTSLIVAAIILVVLSIGLGVVFSIRVGGADMPVLISFLNSTTGLAAAFCGVIVGNRLLIACGATVAASGSILTHVMCKAMNRNLLNIFVGFEAKSEYDWTEVLADESKALSESADERSVAQSGEPPDPFEKAAKITQNAESIIFVPGYGMALAQAQFLVNKISRYLEKQDKQVRFAIHPVAGRMPGHMNVLLAEAEIPYEKLFDMKYINSDFKDTDLAIVIGASDVVNPAAKKAKGTPISGMPILNAHEAKNVIVCNLDERPGYSGVRNSLYKNKNAILLFGDAKETLKKLFVHISGNEKILE